MRPEDKEFLKDIIANPEDDAIRLIYADWLDEHDDPRAELIRVQCELASLNRDDDRWAKLEQRSHELAEEQRSRLLEGIGNWCTETEFHRGFLDAATLHLDPSRMNLMSEKLAWTPLRRLCLCWCDEESVMPLTEWEFLSRVRELTLASGAQDHHEMRKLFSSPHLRNLVSLEIVDECVRGPEGARILADGASLGNLERLSLSHCRIGPTGLEALLGSSIITQLHSFDLDGDRLGSIGAQVLTDFMQWKNLRHLSLASTEITAEGYRALSTARWLSQITRLDLRANGLKPSAIEGFLASPHLGPLKELRLTGNRIGSEGARALAKSPLVQHLEVLTLEGNQIGTEGVQALAESPHLNNLRVLLLDDNRLDDEAAKVLGESENLKNLHLLDLSRSNLSVFGVKALIKPGNLTQLRELQLDNCRLDDRALQVIARSKNLQHLQSLELSRAECRDGKGIEDLITQGNLPQLRKLNLSQCKLSIDSIARLCESDFAQQLTHLDLLYNDLTARLLEPILKLAASKALRVIRLSRWQNHDIDGNALEEAFGERLDSGIPF